MRHPRSALFAWALCVLAVALPAGAQDVPPAAPPRMAAGIADQYHGPGAFVRVSCSATCEVRGSLKVGASMRTFLRLRSRIVGTGRGQLAGAGLLDVLVDLSNRSIRAVRKRHGDQLPVVLSATAKDGQGRVSRLTRKLTIPL